VAQDIAGQNKANPVALIQSSIMMLRYLDLPEYAQKIENAVRHVISEQKAIISVIFVKYSGLDH
jgi:isocitrate dehydrogenase (NAD+)